MMKKATSKNTASKNVFIGTSGWSYKDWKGPIYPADLKDKEFLPWYANHFNCTEINTSFYHLPRAQTIKNWTAMVPDNFKFCPKLSKYITHFQKLQNVEEPLERYFNVFQFMQGKLGPILIQLPKMVKFNAEVVEAFYSLLKDSYKEYSFAIEARDVGWFTPESIALMKKYKIAFVVSYSGGQFPFYETVTAKNVYYRFHGPKELYASNYPDKSLKEYAKQFQSYLSEGHRVWAFFNNSFYGTAFLNATRLNELIKVDFFGN